jgi:hypothetical protein
MRHLQSVSVGCASLFLTLLGWRGLRRAVVAEHNEKIADLLDSKGPSHRDTLAEKMQVGG